MAPLSPTLAAEVLRARKQFLTTIQGVTNDQTLFKPSADEWSIVDNIEHLVWAEMGGINGMWKAVNAYRTGTPLWTGTPIHEGLDIETIVEKTWQPKEQVPEVAKPRWSGSFEFWKLAFQNNQSLLEALADATAGVDVEKVIYPHPISGPLNIVQRFEFLRFHIDRHCQQVKRVMADINFPK